MRNRSIRKNKFNLPSMRRLWKTMGGYDALVEYNECAVRQFIKKWELHKKTNPNYAQFIKEQASEVDIHLGYIDIDTYRQDIYRWYLIHPYGCIDVFVKDFKDDLKIFGFKINLEFVNKSSLEKLISGMKEAGISITIEQWKLDLEAYYRRCRNLLAHKLDKKEEEKIKNIYAALNKEVIHDYYSTLTSALKEPCILTFDDYTLCTANLKNITDTLTTDVYSSIKWEDLDISKYGFTKKFRHFSQDPTRLQTAIRNFFRSKYGISLPDNIIEIYKRKIIDSIE